MAPTTSEKLKDLDLLTRQDICQELNVPRSLGGDYKTLAGLIKMENYMIRIIETKNNPAEEVLHWWETQSSATVPNLRKHFEKMRRDDLVNILDDCSSPGMRMQKYKKILS